MTADHEKSRSEVFGRVLKFGVVGVANNAVGYGIFVVLSLFGAGYVEAMTASYLVGMVISFWGNRSWTFRHDGPVWPTVVRFLVANAIGYTVNFVTLRSLVTLGRLPQIPAQFIAIILVAICTFTLMRLWVFRSRAKASLSARTVRTPLKVGRARMIRLIAGALAGVSVFVGFRQSLPLPAVALAGIGASAISAWPDVVVRDYAAIFHRAFYALAQRSKLPWLLRLATFCFCAVMLFFLVSVLVKPVTPAVVAYDQVIVVVVAGAIMVALPLLYRFAAWAGAYFGRKHGTYWVGFLIAAGVLFFVTQVAIGRAVRVDPGWDAGVLLSTATDLSSGGHFDPADSYFAQYPNNLLLAWVLWLYFSAMRQFGITDTLMAAVVLHSLVMSASVMFMASVGRRIAGYSVAVFFLIPSFVFIALGGWNGVPYSDTFGMIFPAAILWLVTMARERSIRGGLAPWAAAGVLGAIGYLIKPTAIFALAGSCIVVMLWRNSGRLRSALGRKLAIAGIASIVAFGVGAACQSALLEAGVVRTDLRANTNQVPLTHFLKMGANNLGVYELQDVLETMSISDPNARFKNGIDVYVERVREMGPVGYEEQTLKKMIWSVGDGSFFAWGEGMTQFNTKFAAADYGSSVIRKYFTAPGEHSVVMRSLWQACWLVVLLLVAAPLAIRRRTLFGRSATIMRVSLLILIVFLALFENRARYLYLYVPYFLLLASLTVGSAAALARRGLNRKPLREGAISDSIPALT